MENIKYPTSTFDLTVMELCKKVDYWKDRSNYFETLYEEAQLEIGKNLNENLLNAKQGVADALMLCLSLKEDGSGNLLIDKDSRKGLVEYHSKTKK